MANMIPKEPRECHFKSGEQNIFNDLNKLPPEYTVIHSTKLFYYDEDEKTIRYERKKIYIETEREIDFIVFHPEKGILCLEAKNFVPTYEKGEWKTPDGRIMKHDGPYRQAESVKDALINVFKVSCPEIKCKMTWGVWFYPMEERAFDDKGWPPTDAPKERTLTKESKNNIKEAIDKLFDIEVINYSAPSPLTEKQAEKVREFLIPRFEYVPTPSEKVDFNEQSLNKLLEEQKKVLWFLDEQKMAVIHGIGGTGKTMIAIARAKELAMAGQSVLFLCFNSPLAEYLNLHFAFEGITYSTIDSFVVNDLKTTINDPKRYEKAAVKYSEEKNRKEFFKKFQHIVVDEGQDFSDIIKEKDNNYQEEMGSCYVIEALSNAVIEQGGTFFFFYDKHQLIYSKDLTSFIDKADSKLSLYVNCRNTTWISLTTKAILNLSYYNNSNRCIDLKDKIAEEARKNELNKYKTRVDAPRGERTNVYFASVLEENKIILNERIDKYINQLNLQPEDLQNNQRGTTKEIVILTGLTIEDTFISKDIKKVKGKEKWYYTYNGYNIEFSTCRKFKGLEANVIILIDIDERFFNPPKNNSYIGEPNNLVFYVGASRAKHYLDIIFNMNENQCKYLADKLPESQITKSQKKIKEYLHAK